MLRSDPSHLKATYRLGDALLGLGDLVGAKTHLLDAQRLDPNSPQVTFQGTYARRISTMAIPRHLRAPYIHHGYRNPMGMCHGTQELIEKSVPVASISDAPCHAIGDDDIELIWSCALGAPWTMAAHNWLQG